MCVLHSIGGQMPNLLRRFSIPALIFVLLSSMLTLSLLSLSLLTLSLTASAQESRSPADVVANAWKQAQLLGVYRFNSDVEQITYPAASLRNVGRAPSYEYLTANGETDGAAERVEMSLYSGTTPEENAANRMEVRIEGGQGYVRQPDGEWVKREDVSNILLSNGDPLGFIRAIKNVKPVSVADAHPLSTVGYSAETQHFTFDLDAEAFARYSKEQLEALLRARGELPVGVALQANDFHRQMAGSGEIWIAADGLPVRLVMEVAFPPEREWRPDGCHHSQQLQRF